MIENISNKENNMNTHSQELVTTESAQVPVGLDYPATMAVSLARAEIDHQITTARAYPRSVTKAVQNILTLATLDADSADECIYAVTRSGKTLRGPSIRLAEIICSQWGNCRVGARVIHVDRHEKYIEAEAIFHDLETNMATTARVQRRIFDSKGRLFSEDMIMVTGNAACAIARRNAILAGVPKPIWRQAEAAAEKVIKGDAKTLSKRRLDALATIEALGVSQERIFAALGVGGEDDITLDHLLTLTGMRSAIKNGESSVEEMFPFPVNGNKKSLADKMKDLAEDPPHDPETGEILGETVSRAAEEPDQEMALRRAAAEREELESLAREMALSGRREFDKWYTGLAPEQQQVLAPHMKNLMDAANKAGRK